MEIIKSTYPEGKQLPSSKIVICDLHFNASEITKQGERNMLVNNAMPNISYNNTESTEPQLEVDEINDVFCNMDIFDEENQENK